MHQILVTGSNGQLGSDLCRLLAGKPWSVIPATSKDLDITDQAQVEAFFAGNKIDLVINTAAHTAVDKAESEEDASFKVNALGPELLGKACAANGGALIHISTDYVFDGEKPAPYVETDDTNPVNVYGRSKEAGERALREALDHHIILRTAWVFGAHGHNFVKTMLRLAADRDELTIVADQQGNPTAAADLASCIVALSDKILSGGVGNDQWGTYHCVNQESVSWADFAEAIVAYAEGQTGRRPSVRPITTADYPTPAKRPQNSRLDCSKLQDAFGIEMPHWRQTLPGVIDEILKG